MNICSMNQGCDIDSDGFSKAAIGDGGACETRNIGLSISGRFAEALDRGRLIRGPAWGERRVI